MLATGGFEWDRDLVRAFLRGPMTHPVCVADQHRRRPADGDARRRDAGEHARGLVGPRARRAAEETTAWAGCWSTAQRTLPHCDHGQPAGPAIHQRGRQLQRARRRVPRRGRVAASSTSTSRAGWSSTRHYVATCGFRVRARRWRHRCPTGSRGATRPPSWPTRSVSPAAALASDGRAVERASAREGRDPDFGRGRERVRRLRGATRTARASRGRRSVRCDTAPYYAVRDPQRRARHEGRTRDRRRTRRVLDVDGDADPGLYAAGNVMGGPVGHDLRRRRRDARPGHGLRLPRRPPRRRPLSRARCTISGAIWLYFADTSSAEYSPLYDRISRTVAASEELLELIGEAPPTGHQPTVLLAAVHYLLLEGLDHPLASVYAGVSDADPGPLFVDVCLRNRGSRPRHARDAAHEHQRGRPVGGTRARIHDGRRRARRAARPRRRRLQRGSQPAV